MSDALRLSTSTPIEADLQGSGDSYLVFPALSAAQERRLASMLNTHFSCVWRVGRRMGLAPAQAEENAQEAFAVAARKLDRIANGSERAFLLGVAVRLASNLRRHNATRREGDCDEIREYEATDTAPLAEELLSQKEQRALLDRILESMSDDLQQVLTLYEIEELNLPEIAAALEIPEGTAASRLRRAREEFSRRIRRIAADPARRKEKP
jgi:RNA polymerase sigma-70 factor, ECF subfamily